MRTSAPAIRPLLIGCLALVGCHHGTNYKPLHRRPIPPAETAGDQKVKGPRADATPANAQPVSAPLDNSKTPPPAVATPAPRAVAPPAAPAEVPAAKQKRETPAPVVSNRYWCNLARGVDQNNFVVTRYYFTEDLTRSAAADQLVLAKDRPPARGKMSFNDAWSLVTSEHVGAPRTRVTVEPLAPEVAIASPTFDEQNDLMDELVTVNPNVATSRGEIGDHGAVRVTLRDPLAADRPLTFFACEDYSPSFADVKAAAPSTPPPEAATPSPARPTKTPAVPNPPEDPMLKVDPTRLEAPFTPYPISKANFENSRWCSWTKVDGDYKIGVLLIGPNKKVTLSRFLKSRLEADLYGSVALTSLLTEVVRPVSITGETDSTIVTSDGQGYRLVEDKNKSRVLIADAASAASAPAEKGEVFFQCVSTLIPGPKAALRRNLNYYMDLRERWSRE